MKILEILGDMKSSLENAGIKDQIPQNKGFNITGILNFVYAFAGLVAVGFIVYGAVNYAMTQGDPGKIKQAGQTIAFAIIGLIVVLIAAAVTNFVAGAAA